MNDSNNFNKVIYHSHNKSSLGKASTRYRVRSCSLDHYVVWGDLIGREEVEKDAVWV